MKLSLLDKLKDLVNWSSITPSSTLERHDLHTISMICANVSGAVKVCDPTTDRLLKVD